VLTRALVSVLAAGLAAVLMLAAGQQAALVGGGPCGGNLHRTWPGSAPGNGNC
jgi:hypothetical protein